MISPHFMGYHIDVTGSQITALRLNRRNTDNCVDNGKIILINQTKQYYCRSNFHPWWHVLLINLYPWILRPARLGRLRLWETFCSRRVLRWFSILHRSSRSVPIWMLSMCMLLIRHDVWSRIIIVLLWLKVRCCARAGADWKKDIDICSVTNGLSFCPFCFLTDNVTRYSTMSYLWLPHS